jgi:hypothetical protein
MAAELDEADGRRVALQREARAQRAAEGMPLNRVSVLRRRACAAEGTSSGGTRMMTVHKLSTGDGYTYLTRQVASGDRQRRTGEDLAGYYAETGNQPGHWLGSGITALGVSGEVSEHRTPPNRRRQPPRHLARHQRRAARDQVRHLARPHLDPRRTLASLHPPWGSVDPTLALMDHPHGQA